MYMYMYIIFLWKNIWGRTLKHFSLCSDRFHLISLKDNCFLDFFQCNNFTSKFLATKVDLSKELTWVRPTKNSIILYNYIYIYMLLYVLLLIMQLKHDNTTHICSIFAITIYVPFRILPFLSYLQSQNHLTSSFSFVVVTVQFQQLLK